MTQSLNSAPQKQKFSVAINSKMYQNLIASTLRDPARARRFTAAITSAVAVNPALQECDAGTILAGALLGESLNLSPSPQLGQYYLVPFKQKAKYDRGGNMVRPETTTATFVLGYKGYIQLALRSGQYKRLAGGVTVVGDALRAGMALHLERTNLYIASASLAIAGVRTGTYYLWGTEVVNGRVRITNSTSNVGKYGKVTGWISVDDAKAGAGLRDQTTDSRGLTKIVIDYASNVQAMAVYNLAQQLDLVAPGYYRSRYIDAAKTAQYIEIGQISAGDAEHVTTLCKKAAIEYKTAA